MSVEMKKAWELAKSIDDLLRADDPRFQRAVKVIHEDGSILTLENAFVEEYKNYYIVFSEHNDLHIFDKDDVYAVKQYEWCEIEEMETQDTQGWKVKHWGSGEFEVRNNKYESFLLTTRSKELAEYLANNLNGNKSVDKALADFRRNIK